MVGKSADILHFYIKVDKETTEGLYDCEYGYVQHDDNFKSDFIPLALASDSSFVDYIGKNIKYEDYDLNVYIHGMWADSPMFWKETVRNLNRDIFDGCDRPQVIVSVIWEAALLYPNSVDQARKKGKHLQVFFKDLLSSNGAANHINVLAHSMGNRLFEEAIQASLATENCRIDNFISAGADLEKNIFEKNQGLSTLPSICSNITIYCHNNDRTLKVSELINKTDRLGISGLTETVLQDSTFTSVDVTLITDNQGFGGKLFNHRYYYTSLAVKEDIRLILQEKINPKRKQLGMLNKYVLEQ